jgi:hypothetical protein
MALVRVCHNIYIPGQFVVGRVEHRVSPEDEFSCARTTRVRIENAEEIKMKKGREIY